VNVRRLIPLSYLLLTGPAAAQEIGAKPSAPPPVSEQEVLPITKAPTVIKFVKATYPEAAQAQGNEATVGLAVEIDTEGNVLRVEVLNAAGQGFDEAAVAAVETMKFTPAQNAAGPVGVAIQFDYRFTLDPETKDQDLAPINVEGTVVRMGDRTPLGDVQVTIKSGDTVYSVATEKSGKFSFRGVPIGRAVVTINEPGYANLGQKLKVREGELSAIKLWLRPNMKIDEVMVVEGDRPEPDITRRTITVKEIQRIPGTFGDPVRVIQNLPGTARAPFGTGMVVVRGSNPEDTAFYVDGIRVPLIYHLGGLVSIVNEDIVESVDYLPGGYGVEFGRSTGGVINIRTSSDYPKRARAEVSVDVLDATGVIQARTGTDGRWGITAAGRRSYLDKLLPIFTADTGFTVVPYWWDYQVKIDDLKRSNGRLSAMVLGFGDKLYFGTPDDVAQGSDPDNQGDADVAYGAHRVILQYDHRFSDQLVTRFTPSVGYDSIGFSLGSEFLFKQWSWITEVRTDALWEPAPWITVRPGIDVLAGPYEVRLDFPSTTDSLANPDPLAETEDSSFTFEGTFFAVDPFLEAWIHPLDDPEKLKIVPGIRFNTLTMPHYTVTSFDPRLSIRANPFEQTTLKAGTGFYHQPPQGPDLGFDAANIRVDYERSWASEVGVEQKFGPVVEADVTLFYKAMTDLIVQNPNIQSENDPFFVNGGEGRVKGLEMMLRHNPANNFFGWLSYTLSKAERLNVPVDGRGGSLPTDSDDWRPFEFDQTHIFVALAGYDLPRDWGISSRFRYVTGNPTTAYAGAVYDLDNDSYFPYQSSDVMGERLPPFMALDLRVDKRYTYKRWWLETYVDLLNVVRGENPEAANYNYDYTDSSYIRGLPFIPSVGLRAEVAL
jgi:TonB family protein